MIPFRIYTDVSKSFSYSKRFTGKQLNFFRFLATAAFYGTSFLTRPHRPIMMLYNVLFSDQLNTRTEKGIFSILRKFGFRNKTQSV